MVKIKEEPKKGAPAFMATFADLMTLLLVFFILLNVYAREKQHGLLASMSGAFSSAFHSKLGQGGLLDGSEAVHEEEAPRTDFRFTEDGKEDETRHRRSGTEVEMKRSKAEALKAQREREIGSIFSFPHGSDEIPPRGRKYLDRKVRELDSRRSLMVSILTKASFNESITPMELAYRRARAIIRYMKAVGLDAIVEPRASVVETKNPGTVGRDATYRSVELKVTESR